MDDSHTLFEHLQAWRDLHPNDVYLSNDEEKLTVDDTYQSVCFLMDEIHSLGISYGDHVLLRVTRSVQTTLLYYALVAMGVRIYLSDPHENAHDFILENDLSDVKAVFTDERGKWEALFNGIVSTLEFGKKDTFDVTVNRDPNLVTTVLFTSGSTGRRKGVLLSERNIMITDYDVYLIGDYRLNDVSGIILPLNHVFGLCMVVCALLTTHEAYFPSKMDIPSLVHELKDHHVTRLNGVPTLYLALGNELKKQQLDLPELRIGLLGGSPSSVDLFHRLEDSLGMTLLIVYGMTECSGISCCRASDSSSVRADNVGPLCKHTTLCLKPVEGYSFVPGEGEICIKGDGLFAGYINAPKPVDEEGYFHTGDVGKFTADGYLQVTGRVKDIIIRNGVNITTKVVEDAFYSIPGVNEVAVVKKEDPQYGEAPFVFLILNGSTSIEEIMEKAKTLLKKYEYPVGYKEVSSFPKTGSGKIDKISLAKQINS